MTGFAEKSARTFDLLARGLPAAMMAMAVLVAIAAPASAAIVTVNTTVDQSTGGSPTARCATQWPPRPSATPSRSRRATIC